MGTATHMSKMKNNAIVGNIGHFDNEIDMAGLTAWEGVVQTEIKPQVDSYKFPDGHNVIILAAGRLLKPRLCHWTSIIRHVQQFHQLGHRPAGALGEQRNRQIPKPSIYPPQASRREGCPPPSRRRRS